MLLKEIGVSNFKFNNFLLDEKVELSLTFVKKVFDFH